MTAFDTLERIADNPAAHSIPCNVPPVREAVRIIEARTGQTLSGPVTALRKDLRIAVMKLARQLMRNRMEAKP